MGLLTEVWFTGIYSFVHKNWRGTAETHLLMIPGYIAGGVAFKALHDSIILSNNIFLNAIGMSFLFYTPLSFGFEFLYGVTIQKFFGKKLWDYGLSKFTPFGLINLKYAPWWFTLSLIFQISIVYIGKIEALLIQ
jgi:hypothetical protein